MADHAAKRPFPLTPESKNHPWLGVHQPDPTRDGTSPNSTILGEPFHQPPEGFADGGIIGEAVTPLPSPGSALQPQLLAAGGKVKKGADKDFRAKTQKASALFQATKGAAAAGIAGGITGAVLGAPSGPQHAKLLKGKRFADGGEVEEENPEITPEDLGSGTLSDAATDLTGRELQVENAIRAAEGLPPLKTKK